MHNSISAQYEELEVFVRAFSGGVGQMDIRTDRQKKTDGPVKIAHCPMVSLHYR